MVKLSGSSKYVLKYIKMYCFVEILIVHFNVIAKH